MTSMTVLPVDDGPPKNGPPKMFEPKSKEGTCDDIGA
jgi:hypothetical protein